MKKIGNSVKNILLSNTHLLLVPIVSLVILYLHYIHSLSFSFTDAYNSYARAYFMGEGRQLYAEIFHHHNMLMVYISYVLQQLLNPQTLYELVMQHRMFVGLLSVVLAALLIWRFRWGAVAFVVVYETAKYYLFGNLFLAEALVPYLLVYLLGISWEKLRGISVSKFDIVLATFFAWLIVFLREPFIPVAGLLFAYIILDKNYIKTKIISVIFFTLMSLLLIATVNWEEYYYHMITLNFSGYIQSELESKGVGGVGILKAFFYPIFVFIEGSSTEFRIILLLISSLFILAVSKLILEGKYKLVLFLVLVLGLANIRYRNPGDIFYEGVHMLPYFSLITFSVILLAKKVAEGKKMKWYRYLTAIFLSAAVLIALLPPYSTASRSMDRNTEFNMNYGRFYANGEVIRILSNENDQLFAEDWDTLVYWQSGLDSSYQYAMYFPVMEDFEKYRKAKIDMYESNPPEFYYTECHRPLKTTPFPPTIAGEYTRLYSDGNPTCLFVHNEKIKQIPDGKWEEVEKIGFTKPQNQN